MTKGGAHVAAEGNGLADPYADIREAVRKLCERFPGEYWRELDRERGYPDAFVTALTEAGYLGCLIPERFGGAGLPVAAACAVLEEIHRSGGNGAACHAQMYTMGAVLRHGSDEQKERYLPDIASGALRLQAFGVTEPGAGSDTLAIRTRARKVGSSYVISGQKVWTSRAQHSDLMLLLARTSPQDDAHRTAGLSLFLVDMREALKSGLVVRPLRTMLNHATTEVFLDEVPVPKSARIGEEGQGFRYLLDGLNAERILVAAECIGDARFFIDRAVAYAGSREVFGRPIGRNQGVQFPIARAWAHTEAAALMVERAVSRFDAALSCGAQANTAKLLAADASWEAAECCLQTHGGYGFAEDYDIERKFRETRLYQVAPVSTNLILSYIGQHVLGLPRSY